MTDTAFDNSHPTRTASPRGDHPQRALRIAGGLALVAGAALTADTVTIAVLNRAFDPVDSVLFLTGFAGLWLTGVALAVALSAGRRSGARVARAVAVFVVTTLALGAVSAVFDQLGRHLFSPANRGLHGEWSFFSIGVCLLVLAGWAFRTSRRR